MVEYTVQRINKADDFVGAVHYADATETTYCGKKCNNEHWYFFTSDGSGVATCRKCIKIKEEKE